MSNFEKFSFSIVLVVHHEVAFHHFIIGHL